MAQDKKKGPKTNQRTAIGDHRDIYVEKVPPEVMRAFRQKQRGRKKLENRGIVGVVADAIRGRNHG